MQTEGSHLCSDGVVGYGAIDYIVVVMEVLVFVAIIPYKKCPFSTVMVEHFDLEIWILKDGIDHFILLYDRFSTKKVSFVTGHILGLRLYVGEVEGLSKIFVALRLLYVDILELAFVP